MKHPFIILLGFILFIGICICGFLLNDNHVLYGNSLRQMDLSQSVSKTGTETTWSIGIYTGPSPFQLSSPPNVSNPVLTAGDVTDVDAALIAHPFMTVTDSVYYMFFTVKVDDPPFRKRKGCQWLLQSHGQYFLAGSCRFLLPTAHAVRSTGHLRLPDG